jgi:hypothetical protein
MLRLNAVFPGKQNPRLLQNDDIRACAPLDHKGACIGERSTCCCRALHADD